MSASTQTGQTTNGNGHTSARKARSPESIARQKATAARTAASKAAAAKAALQAGQQPAGTIGGAASQANVAARRIGAPVLTPGLTPFNSPGTPVPGTLAWLYARQQEIDIEGRLIRSMIASFGPRKAMTTTATGTPRKTKRKSKRKSPMKRAA